MSLDDDQWALDKLKQLSLREQERGVTAYRLEVNGVVHRIINVPGHVETLCGLPIDSGKVTTRPKDDPGMLTCIACIGEGG